METIKCVICGKAAVVRVNNEWVCEKEYASEEQKKEEMQMSSGPEFFQTMMGRKFYEHDVPKIVEALLRVAVALEDVTHQLRRTKSCAEGAVCSEHKKR